VRYFTGKMSHEGGTAYVAVGVNPSVHFVHVVEIQAMQQGLVKVDAAALGQALDRDGRVVVEGIYFDTDSARLQPASDAALGEIARLLRERSGIRLYVVGHTDSQGSFAHNQRLSADRAASVVEALGARFGVARERLAAHGVGPLAPAAGNASEAGRAQNRRVEIVLQ
jgi:outer membrane protein OmpA-like peptidoglycan-associated protein